MDVSELVNTFFGRFINLRPEHVAFFESRLIPRTFAARQLILEPGNKERYFYLVKSGVQALYLIDGKGEKVVFGFSYTWTVSGGYDSFVLQQPSQLFIEAITPSELMGLSKPHFDELFVRFPEFYVWRSHFLEMLFFGRISREREFMTLSARDRFVAFMNRCPEELLQIPQKYLASYLGMKPETFSRLRAERLS